MSEKNLSRQPTSSHENSDEIDIIALAGILLENKITIIFFTMLFTITGVIYYYFSAPIYRADTTIQIEEKTSSMVGLGDMADAFGTKSGANAEIQLIKSRRIIGKAVDELNLDTIAIPQYFPFIGETIARRHPTSSPTEKLTGPASFISNTFGSVISKIISGDFEGIERTRYAWGGEIIDLKHLTLPQNTSSPILTLIAKGGEKFAVYDRNNQLIIDGETGKTLRSQTGHEIYISELKARSGTRFIVGKRNRLHTTLGFQGRIGVSEIGKNTGILTLTFEHKDPRLARRFLEVIADAYVKQNIERQSAEAARSLEFLKGQLPELKRNLEKSEQELNRYQVEVGSVNISAEAQVLLEQVVEIESRIAELQLQKSELDRKFTTGHPQYVAWQEQMKNLKARKAELDSRVRNLPKTQQEVLGLTRDLEVGTEIYTQMLNNIQELDIIRAGTVGNVRIIDEAVVNTSAPVKPRRNFIIMISTVFGVFTGIGIVLLRSMLNRGITNPEDIEAIGLPVYTSIPLSDEQRKLDGSGKRRHAIRKKQKNQHPHDLLAHKNPTDIAVESLRNLRTSLHFAMLEAENNVMMISGPSPNVGKSFVSGNLAAVVAQAGQRVLLIDMDLRKGYMHKMFDMQPDNGVSDVLGKRISV